MYKPFPNGWFIIAIPTLVDSLDARSAAPTFRAGQTRTQPRVETRWNRRSTGRVERVLPQNPTCEVDMCVYIYI